MKKKKARVLFFDIETTPNLGYIWGKWQQDVIAYKKEWTLLCFAYKWQGEKEIKCITSQRLGEKGILKLLWTLFNEADLIIAHNGDAFDIKKTNARFLHYGLKPPSPYKTIDTKKVAKKYFKFNTNKLDDLGNYLGVGRKLKHQGFDLWLGCMAGTKKAWATMSKYNKQDVALLEKVYLKMRPWQLNHPNLSLLEGYRGCPNCGSKDCQKRGVRANHRTCQQQWHCQSCRAWFLSPFKQEKL